MMERANFGSNCGRLQICAQKFFDTPFFKRWSLIPLPLSMDYT
jgi:hypothetical protein